MSTQRYINTITAGFAALVIVYAASFAADDPAWLRPAAKTLPVLFLSICAWRAGGSGLSFVPVALLLSSMGDLAGDLHAFLWQIGLFAAAHTAYIAAFCRRRRPTRGAVIFVVMLALAAAALAGYFISHVGDSTEKICIRIYIAVITCMCATAALQQSSYRALYAAAALVFIFSDACIAWNKYIEPIPHAAVWIMSTYFAAQYTIARLYIRERLG